MVLAAYCVKCRRRIASLFLIGICVECDAELTPEARESVPQEIWDRLHSAKFRAKYPTPASFDTRAPEAQYGL